MSATEALRYAENAGVRVRVDGEHLELAAFSEPPAFVVELLCRHKTHVIALLLSSDHGWSHEDWRAYFDERAGIAEYDGKLSRGKAEALAFGCCVLKWLELTFRCPEPRHCKCVGNPPSDLSFGPEVTGWISPTSRCRRVWQTEAWCAAFDFLEKNGIEPARDRRLQRLILRRLQQDFLLAEDDSSLPSIQNVTESA